MKVNYLVIALERCGVNSEESYALSREVQTAKVIPNGKSLQSYPELDRKIYEYLQENKFGADGGDFLSIPDTEYDIYDLEENDEEKLSLWKAMFEVTLDENFNPIAAKQIDDELIEI